MSEPQIHSYALCESRQIGARTRVWAFAHILPGAVIGEDCNICDGVFVENDVVVGDRVTVKCGVQLWDGVRLEDDVFVGPNATFTNDMYPRSGQHQERVLETVIKRGASIGANATILPGITVGEHAMVGAGAIVTNDVPPGVVVVGTAAYELKRSKESLYRLRSARDERGSLVAQEFADLPFLPRRTFLVYDVPNSEIRGEHAHRVCHQLLVCVTGSFRCDVDNGKRVRSYLLDSPELGLYLPPMHWASQREFSDDAVLCVLASHPYDEDDYIRDYASFLASL